MTETPSRHPSSSTPASTPTQNLGSPTDQIDGHHPQPTTVPDPWLRSHAEVTAALDVDPTRGLTTDTAGARLSAVGPNELAEHRRRPALLRFLDQFRSVLILVLVGAAALAGLVGDVKDTIVIAVVLLINATIGFVQEQRAERSLDALKQMLTPTTRVRRDGRVQVLDAADVVPGDVVLLEAGDRVPADGRLLVAATVEVDESPLTGESVPVAKTTDALLSSQSKTVDGEPSAEPAEILLAERRCMLHMNTALTRGRAEMVVTATGMRTEVGEIAELLTSGTEPPSPLQVQLDSVGKRLALIGGIAVIVYSALALVRGESLADLAIRAVALAVATVPEGLPAVLALTLALGVQRMARRSAIVKRLASVETLGSATVVCSDKTGTLTLNEMTAREVLTQERLILIGGRSPESDPELQSEPLVDRLPIDLVAAAVLCNDARRGSDGLIGDPTETALLALALKTGIDPDALTAGRPRVAEIPFDAAYKYMATFHAPETGEPALAATNGSVHQQPDHPAAFERVQVYVKGAADVLLERCTSVLGPDARPVPLSDARRDGVERQLRELAGRGLRVLALAHRFRAAPDVVDAGSDADLHRSVDDLTLLGLVGIADPPRPEAREAIRLCSKAGVAVKMITGDHAATAAAIAAELGIRGRVVTGAELDAWSDDELADRVDDIGVFARVAPEHKVAIVRALTARGHVVAMTGDGVNDAAALRSAHIGVAMGVTGTEVTKEAGDMILTDDNFATIVGAVEEGRAIYDNVVKFVRFQLSTNMGAILTFLGTAVLGLPAPLTAVQILWVNIIMDGPPAMALGVDPARPGIMNEAPRRAADRILSRTRLLKLLRVGAVMAGGTLSVLALASAAYGTRVGLTMAFTTFVLFQIVNAFNARAEHQTIFTRHLFTNRWLWLSLGTVLLLQVAAVHLPVAQQIFETVALSPAQWGLCAMAAVSVLLVEELAKLARRSRRGSAT